MNTLDLIRLRLFNQQLSSTSFKDPADLVQWMIAMQAQEYAMAKWAIGLRLQKATEPLVEKAFNEGDILRTHLMRPTWHFVHPADIRWLVALTAPRVAVLNGPMFRQTGLDNKILKRTNDILARALEGGKYLTRSMLQTELKKKKIIANGVRLAYIMMQAELDAIVCSGPRLGKQFTYALLEERACPAKPLKRDEALVQFGRRYFTSRGPATIHDFAYWSGLTIKDAKQAASALPLEFERETVDGSEYIFLPPATPVKKTATFLMPDYDEYGMSYKNRNALLSKNYRHSESSVYSHWLVLDGVIEGVWERIEDKKGIAAKASPFITLNKSRQKLVATALKKYRDFHPA